MADAFDRRLYRFDLLDEWANHLAAVKNRSPKSIYQYRSDVMNFIRHYALEAGDIDSRKSIPETDFSFIDRDYLNRIKLRDIYAYQAYLLSEEGLKSSTIARRASALSSFFSFLYEKLALIDENPCQKLELPKRNRQLPRYLHLEEAEALLSTVLRSAEESKSAIDYRDYTILILFLNCGLRLAELCQIDLRDIKEERVTVIGKGHKERVVHLNQACLDAIELYIPYREQLKKNPKQKALFISRQGNRLAHSSVQRMVKIRLERAGLDSNKLSPHKLRHTCATLLYQYGKVDIRTLQGILGHESVQTTQIYTHISDEQLEEAVKKNPLASFQMTDSPSSEDE
ncbi:MAG: tyrosine recombinase XerC [Eubacteriales bacterium]|nr:tyrosine recombinase XerC [Eubacteriales bacterium]